jgi:tetratricopeptide (TPR) repeat protein
MKIFTLVFLLLSVTVFSQKRFDYFDAVYPEYDSLLAVAKKAKVDSLKANTLNKLANRTFFYSLLNGTRGFEAPEYYATMALETAKKINSKREMGEAFYSLGVISAEKSNYSEALKNFFVALKLTEDLKDKKRALNQHLSIGKVYMDIGNYSDALKHYLTTLNQAKEIGEKGPPLFNAYRYAGIIYHKLGNYEEALKFFFAGHKAAEAANVANALSIFYRYIGNVYKDMGNYEEALKYQLQGLKNIFNPDGTPRFIGHAAWYYTDIGILYNSKAAKLNVEDTRKNYADALMYLQKGLDFAKKVQSKTTIIDAYAGLADAYNGIGDYKNALFYTKQYAALKDSVFNNETFKKISELKVQYEMEKAQLEERAHQQLALAQEKSLREKLLFEQKLHEEQALNEQKHQQEKTLAEEKNQRELVLADQKIQQEKKTAEERAKYDKTLALEKIKQEKLRGEKQRMNTIWLIGILAVSVISALLFVLFRQRVQKRRAIEKAQALHKMSELELQSLRAQLNPHFMFNSLNSYTGADNAGRN